MRRRVAFALTLGAASGHVARVRPTRTPLLLPAALLALACSSARPVAAPDRPVAPELRVDAGGVPAPVIDGGLPEAALPHPDDALEALWSRQLEFRDGVARVTVRLMEGQSEVRFSPRARMALRLRGTPERLLSVAGGRWVTATVVESKPAVVGWAVQLAEFRQGDLDGLVAARAAWAQRGHAARIEKEGAVYGIAGHVLDTRRSLLLLGEHGAREKAVALQEEIGKAFGESTLLHARLMERPRGAIELRDEGGNLLGRADSLAVAEAEGEAGFEVKRVEFGVGYAFHSFADRKYRGSLLLTVDTAGKLALVNSVPLEELLRGLVPSEIFPNSHPEALKAQAVTARGEVLAKVGVRHLEDPYLFCAEQHCQVYLGEGNERPATDEAIRATAGEVLFEESGGGLVDTVYSALCGGYTESNEHVWAGPAQASLRAVPDVVGDASAFAGGIGHDKVAGFLASKAPFACRIASRSNASKFRWTQRFTAAEVDALFAPSKLGHVVAMKVAERGESGRAYSLTVSGEEGATEVRGELNIRRRFRNLNSALFLVTAEKDPKGRITGWSFQGGGWGHGVGLCQTGAIGRAEAGQTYKQILGHYFQHSELVRIR